MHARLNFRDQIGNFSLMVLINPAHKEFFIGLGQAGHYHKTLQVLRIADPVD